MVVIGSEKWRNEAGSKGLHLLKPIRAPQSRPKNVRASHLLIPAPLRSISRPAVPQPKSRVYSFASFVLHTFRR
ncbi:hypothetical protein PSAB6_310028 [Paraburkholderia sabiae]|nr:hypothetical protein PSAB6_310028 [Paraburkholderia sabiae]